MRGITGIFGVGTLGFILTGTLSAQTDTGESMYKASCAQCHDAGVGRAPQRDLFRQMSPERVLAAMETGPMISMAIRWPEPGRRQIAEYLTGKTLGSSFSTDPPPQAMCAPGKNDFNPATGAAWTGWGVNTSNTRFQSAAGAGLAAAQVPRLKLKWAFAFPGELTANGHPTYAGGRVFVGSPGGGVYSLSAATGCIHWHIEAGSQVRSAITVGKITTASGPLFAAFFGDGKGQAWAVDAATGKEIWKTRVDDFPVARLTGSPVLYNGRLYVPVASGEEAAGSVPSYECCRFRGSLVALDAATGKQIWKTWTIDEPAKPTTKNKIGTQLWGPSGAPIWSTPAIDTKLGVIYVTTGDNYTEPGTKTSDAFMALDLMTGKIRWTRQMTADDAYTSACRLPDRTNCPEVNGPDFDFGASPILVNLRNGKRVLLAGQKSGIVHALDPDRQGAVLWQVRVGKGGTMGGVQWGSAADASNIYVAVSDIKRIMLDYSTSTDTDASQGGGMFALRLDNGERMWYTAPASCGDRKRCSPAQSAAVSAMPGAAFSGSVDGHLRAYSASNGKVIWDFDTIQTYKTVNGAEGHGGSLDGPGPVIAGGMVFANSGYSAAGGTPGNVLLAFSVDGK
ncbi:MAG TPA: PQQ-binding-like beta-propeller repeat protein [Bryobacteraceae bacterium]|nr:PQQ-binding-like beta-propeller repeat protein [Bryobacteraceae bacterium]